MIVGASKVGVVYVEIYVLEVCQSSTNLVHGTVLKQWIYDIRNH